ncbi:MAG: restriction endonuclease subunit S [Rickettsiales bacterium]|nr:restriction endonuclease subunit S [Rickettsiales bacterium]
MRLSDREWGEFRIINIFGNSINAKAYHFSDLEETNDIKNSIPYITRTNMNNGLFCLVKKEKYFKKNIKNTICFGAENATYFYQPYDYLTGNKMYYYVSNNLSKYSLLFIVSCLNKSIFDCGFGYGMGLTGSRSDTKKSSSPQPHKAHQTMSLWKII